MEQEKKKRSGKDVQIGDVYIAKVSGVETPVRIVRKFDHGGWVGLNEHTNREVRIKSVRRLRRAVFQQAKTPVEKKPVEIPQTPDLEKVTAEIVEVKEPLKDHADNSDQLFAPIPGRSYVIGDLPAGTEFTLPPGHNILHGTVLEIIPEGDAKVWATHKGGKQGAEYWSQSTVVIVGESNEDSIKSTSDENQFSKITNEGKCEMKVQEKEIRDLLTGLGHQMAAKDWSVKKIQGMINNSEEFTELLEGAPEPEGKALKLLQRVNAAVLEGTEIVVEPEKDETIEAPAKKEVKSGSYPKVKKEVKGSSKAKKETKVKKEKLPSEKKSKSNGDERVSIVGTILDCLSNNGPVSKESLIAKVNKKFPGRDPKTQIATVSWQLATGLPRKGHTVIRSEDGLYSIKG